MIRVGEANLGLFERLLPRFGDEESNSIIHHRKPLLEGESRSTLSEAIETVHSMDHMHEVGHAQAMKLLHSLEDARRLRNIALQVGDQTGE
jgi:hypothetical protein